VTIDWSDYMKWKKRQSTPLEEHEWWTCAVPSLMMLNVRRRLFFTERKLRLFLVACSRLAWYFVPRPPGREAVEVAERYADGLATPDELLAARRQVIPSRHQGIDHMSACVDASAVAPSEGLLRVVESALLWGSYVAGSDAHTRAIPPRRRWAMVQEGARQAELVREFFGPLPFRRVVCDPAWLAWDGGTVAALAQAIYEERAFYRMAILADALEDAGCDDAQILAHCRSDTTHVRGCWVLDALLGKD
jgi:hypothetical protein